MPLLLMMLPSLSPIVILDMIFILCDHTLHSFADWYEGTMNVDCKSWLEFMLDHNKLKVAIENTV